MFMKYIFEILKGKYMGLIFFLHFQISAVLAFFSSVYSIMISMSKNFAFFFKEQSFLFSAETNYQKYI